MTANLAEGNPFYAVSLFHEIYHREFNNGLIDVRVKASVPCHVQIVDEESGAILGVDAEGDGDFLSEGDVLADDSNRNGYPDLQLEPDQEVTGLELRVFPVKSDETSEENSEISITVELRNRETGQWEPHAVNKLVSSRE